MTTYDIDALKAEFRLSNDGDAWGTTMRWLFTIADELHFNRERLEVPEAWDYRPSPLGPSRDDEDLSDLLANADEGALIEFANMLWRLRGILKAQGRDY